MGTPLTETERAERRAADRDRLERAARELLTTEGWRRWVRVRSTNGLARYSFGNQLLIAMQRPDATYVAGFRAFLELDRCVRKGEKAIRILAPMSVRARKDEPAAEPQPGEETEPRRLRFRAVAGVRRLPDRPAPGHRSGAARAAVRADRGLHPRAPVSRRSRRSRGSLGYSVSVRALDGSADGWCDSAQREIVVNASVSAERSDQAPRP